MKVEMAQRRGVPPSNLRRWAQPIAPLIFLLATGFAREVGGDAFTPLVVLPVIWFALHGTRTELLLGVLVATAVVAEPLLLDEEVDAVTALTETAVWFAVLGTAGFATFTLVREREALLDEVALLARTDPLTGLANRRAWGELLRRETARAARDGSAFSVAIIDVDRFKDFNDRHGHAAGDRLLKEAAGRWSEQVRSMDVIARYGGEEFAVLLPGAGCEDAIAVTERIRGHTPEGVTISGGVAQWDGIEHPDALLARADAALYRAKREGRDLVRIA